MNPFTPMVSLVILFTVYHILLTILVWRICIDSNTNPLIDIFLNSHYLFTWDCIDILKKILSWSLREVKGFITRKTINSPSFERGSNIEMFNFLI